MTCIQEKLTFLAGYVQWYSTSQKHLQDRSFSIKSSVRPLYCVRQPLCILQPVLPSCGILGVHTLKIKRKSKGIFSIVSLFRLLLAWHWLSGERWKTWIPCSTREFSSDSFLFLSFFSKTAEDPACRAGKVLPNNKRHRGCRVFDFVGDFQLHWKVLHSSNQ